MHLKHSIHVRYIVGICSWSLTKIYGCNFFFQLPAIKGAEATLSEAIKEGSDMATLFYAVAAQNYLGLKGESSVIRGFRPQEN